jgi:hypothetical protein
MSIKHSYTIICDDVRREDNGKLLLLGMYLGTIAVPQLPTLLPSFTVLSIFESDRPGTWSWKLAIQRLESGKTIAEAKGFANVQQPGTGVMPIKFGGLRFDETGAYAVTIEIEGQPEPFVTNFFVVLTPPQITPQPQTQFPGR